MGSIGVDKIFCVYDVKISNSYIYLESTIHKISATLRLSRHSQSDMLEIRNDISLKMSLA